MCVCVCVYTQNALREEFDLNYFFSEMLESLLLLFMPLGQFVEYFIQRRNENNNLRSIDENIIQFINVVVVVVLKLKGN